MLAYLLCLATVLVSLASWGAEAVQEGKYFDETGQRYLTLEKAGSGSTRLIVRFATDPGSVANWTGLGQYKDKQLTFAQEVEDGADRGTYFLANVSESKVEIIIKPGQKKAQDVGIVGTYHHASDPKLQQQAKKEAVLANTRLQTALKAGPKKWSTADRPALLAWKDQWPALRDRWLDLSLSAAPVKKGAPATPPPAAPPPPPAATMGGDKPTAYWAKMAEATMYGYTFVETPPAPKTGTGWEGEYDDFAGGHASLTVMKDGGLHVTLTISRAGDSQTGTIDTLVKASDVTKDKNGNPSADFEVADPEVTEAAQRAKIHLTKFGHYLQVDAQKTQHYSARGWFEGVYRGQPPSTE